LNGEEGPGGMAIPGDYEETQSMEVEEGITMTQYFVDEDSTQVLNDLQDSAEDAGWEVMAEWESTVAGYDVGVALEKDDRAMVISTVDVNGQTNAIILEGPVDTVDPDVDEENDEEENDVDEEEEPPTQDVEGEDLEDVPRYPDSVLTSYDTGEWTENDEEYLAAILHYLAEEDAETIADWYESELPDYGWNIQVAGEDNGEHYIYAEDEPFGLGIIIESSDDYEGYSEIEINYGDFTW